VAKPIRLSEDGPGLAAVSPLAATFLEKASGTLSGKATLSVMPNGLTTAGQAVVKGLAGAAGPVTLAGVSSPSPCPACRRQLSRTGKSCRSACWMSAFR
jgi:hypothetical protein